MDSLPRSLAHAVHTLLVDLDPARASAVTAAQRGQALLAAQAAGRAVVTAWKDVAAEQQQDTHLHQACVQLDHVLATTVAPTQDAGWLDARDHLSPFYEALVTALRRHGERVPTLHPTNLRRTSFHILSGVAVVLAFERVLTPVTAVWAAGAFCVFAWTLELARVVSPGVNALLMKAFKPIARDHERYRVNSSTWYGTALLLIALTAPNAPGMLGVLALALGDPAAGYVGRRFGRFRIFGGKSLEGTVAFAVASLAGGLLYAAVSGHLLVGTTTFWALPLTAAVVGAVVELVATRVDDNLAVPVVTAWAALLVQRLLG